MLFSPATFWCFLTYGIASLLLVLVSATSSLIFNRSYGFTAKQTGLVSISPLVASILMSLVAGYIADFLAVFMARRNKGVFEPEHRLILMLPYALLVIFGCEYSDSASPLRLAKRQKLTIRLRRRRMGHLIPQPEPLDGPNRVLRVRHSRTGSFGGSLADDSSPAGSSTADRVSRLSASARLVRCADLFCLAEFLSTASVTYILDVHREQTSEVQGTFVAFCAAWEAVATSAFST